MPYAFTCATCGASLEGFPLVGFSGNGQFFCRGCGRAFCWNHRPFALVGNVSYAVIARYPPDVDEEYIRVCDSCIADATLTRETRDIDKLTRKRQEIRRKLEGGR